MTVDPANAAVAAIETRALVKQYGEIRALNGLDLRVEEGVCFGLLGPNGAGKTTTVSILTTLARPDAGVARIFGHDVLRERAAVRDAIGLVFQEPSLDPELTAREQLDLHARLHHLATRRRKVEEALVRVGLSADADRPVRGLSGGMRRRIEIVRGMLHGPRLLFLDEPTLGLDVGARETIREALRSLRDDRRMTLFLTTHDMDEAAALCDRVAIVDRGRVVIEGPPASLIADLGGDVVILTARRANGIEARLAAVRGVSRVVPDTARDGGCRFRIVVREGTRALPILLDAAREHEVEEVELHRPTLAHVFLHHTGHPFEIDAFDARSRTADGGASR